MSFRTLFFNLLVLASLAWISQCAVLSREVTNFQATPDAARQEVDVHGTYMRATQAKDGSIIGVYEAFEGPNALIRVVKSTNAGNTWNPIGTVTTVLAEKQSIANPFILQLPDGRLLVASRYHDRDGKNGYSTFRISLFGSDDGGSNWSNLGNIDERKRHGVNGLWEPFLRISHDGTIQAFYSSENNEDDQNNIMKTSKDNGKSWSKPMPVSGQDIRTRDGMTGVANIDNNGNVICVFESLQNNIFTIDYVISHDDGFTWPTRGRLYTAKDHRDAGAPQVINVGGTLVASFMSNEEIDRPNGKDVDGGQMKIITSINGGRDWDNVVVAGTNGSHWPGLFSVSNCHFLGFWQQDPVGLVSQKFRLVHPGFDEENKFSDE